MGTMTSSRKTALLFVLLPVLAPGLACSEGAPRADKAPAQAPAKAQPQPQSQPGAPKPGAQPAAPPAQGGAGSKQPMTADKDAGKDARPEDKQGWAEAEAVVRKHLEKKRKKVTQLDPYRALPYLFSAAYGGGGEHVLVSGGKVVTERGLPALSAYAERSGLAGRGDLAARDVLHLVEVLEAYPPVKGYAAPPGYYRNPKPDAPLSPLNPQLAREGGALRLQLHYIIGTPPGPGGGSPSDAGVTHLGRWTLTLAPGAKAAWTEERLAFDSKAGRFRAE